METPVSPQKDSANRIECVRLPEDHDQSLPANLDRVITTLEKKQLLSPFEAKKWSQYFRSAENTCLITDLFWLGIARLVHPDQLPDLEALLLDRVAANYVALLLKVEPSMKDMFYKHYADLLAQTVYFLYYCTYPKSRGFLASEKFLQQFLELINSTFTGLPVKHTAYLKWEFDLGFGNIFKLRHEANPNLPSEVPRSRVELKYSPLVSRYFKNQRYRGVNLIKKWRMGFTQRNLAKERVADKRIEYYRRITEAAVNSARQVSENCLKKANTTRAFSKARTAITTPITFKE